MKVRLFRVPYLFDDGIERERICAAVTGVNPEREFDVQVVQAVKDALVKCEAEPTVIALPGSIDIGWL